MSPCRSRPTPKMLRALPVDALPLRKRVPEVSPPLGRAWVTGFRTPGRPSGAGSARPALVGRHRAHGAGSLFRRSTAESAQTGDDRCPSYSAVCASGAARGRRGPRRPGSARRHRIGETDALLGPAEGGARGGPPRARAARLQPEPGGRQALNASRPGGGAEPCHPGRARGPLGRARGHAARPRRAGPRGPSAAEGRAGGRGAAGRAGRDRTPPSRLVDRTGIDARVPHAPAGAPARPAAAAPIVFGALAPEGVLASRSVAALLAGREPCRALGRSPRPARRPSTPSSAALSPRASPQRPRGRGRDAGRRRHSGARGSPASSRSARPARRNAGRRHRDRDHRARAGRGGARLADRFVAAVKACDHMLYEETRRPARCAAGMGRPDRGPERRRTRQSAVRRRRAVHPDDLLVFAAAARALATSSAFGDSARRPQPTPPSLGEPYDLAVLRAALQRLLADSRGTVARRPRCPGDRAGPVAGELRMADGPRRAARSGCSASR